MLDEQTMKKIEELSRMSSEELKRKSMEQNTMPPLDLDHFPTDNTESFEYLIDRIKSLHDRKFFLNEKFYEEKMNEYCERLKGV